MKTISSLIVVFAFGFSAGCFAQENYDLAHSGMGSGPSASEINDGSQVIISYHVEERINMKFGSRITTYDVPSLKMVNTNDLGPDNSRVVTPVFGKVKPKPVIDAVAVASAQTAVASNAMPTANLSLAPRVMVPLTTSKTVVEKTTSVRIDLVNTYERVLEKGYESADLIRKVADARFFDGDLEIAEKWYSKLFKLTTNLEDVYFYRYAQALKSVNKFEEAKQMMAIFESRAYKK